MARHNRNRRNLSSFRQSKGENGNNDDCCGSGIMAAICMLIALITSGGAMDPANPWVSAHTVLPVNRCTNGTRVQEEFERFVVCTDFYTSTESFYVKVTPMQAARLSTTDGAVISDVAWSDLNAENTCSNSSLLFQPYGIPNQICNLDGEFTLTNPFPLYVAIIITLTFVSAHIVIGCFIGTRKDPAVRLNGAIGLFILAATAFVSTVYGWTFWQSFPLRNNYLTTRVTNVAPMWNFNITYMGLTRADRNRVVTVYQVDFDDSLTLVPTPPLILSYDQNGFELFTGTLVVMSILMALLLCAFKMRLDEKRQPPTVGQPSATSSNSGVPQASFPMPPEATIPTAIPVGTAIPQATYIDGTDFEKQDVPRPDRPAPPPNNVITII